MRAWILAAVAALAVGQAEARTITYNSGHMGAQNSCLTNYLDDVCQGPAKAETTAIYWTMGLSVDIDSLTFTNGTARVEWNGTSPTIFPAKIYRWTGAAWEIETKTASHWFEPILIAFDLAHDGKASNWEIMTETMEDFGTWYLDDTGATLWAFSDGDQTIRTEYIADGGIAPVPLPATAPLLLICLSVLARRNRHKH